MAEVLTAKKTESDKVYTVLVDCLGTHQREDAPLNSPKGYGETVTVKELGPHCDVARLLTLGAIREGVILPADLPDRRDPNRAHFDARGNLRVVAPPPAPRALGTEGRVRPGIVAQA